MNQNNTVSTHSQGWLATKAMGKASLGLLNPKMWALSLIPFALAALFWGAVAYFLWEPANNISRTVIGSIGLPSWITDLIPAGMNTWLDTLRAVWAPLVVMMLLIPGVILTVFVLVGLLGSTVVANHVSKQYELVPLTQSKTARGISVLGSVWHSSWVLTVLVVLWILTLPLWLIPGLGFIIPIALLAWANARLFTRDALVDFATTAEIATLKNTHGSTLFSLGLLASLPACIPSFLWLFGGMTIVALPLLGAIAVWLYVMMFIATALLFSHYVLAALRDLRGAMVAATPQTALDPNPLPELAPDTEPALPDPNVIDSEVKEVKDTALSLEPPAKAAQPAPPTAPSNAQAPTLPPAP